MAKRQITKKVGTVASENDIKALGKMGTKEAIAKIEAYLKKEKDLDKKELAELALEECENIYYEPTTEKEDEEFYLSWLIMDKENEIAGIEDRIDSLEFSLDKFEIEKKVHARVLAKNKEKKEDWKYFCVDESVLWKDSHLAELKEDLAYLRAWVDEAKKMITTKRYKSGIPMHHLEKFDFSDYEENCCSGDCCSDDCGHEDCYDVDCCHDTCCGGDNREDGSIDSDEIPF